MSASTTTQPTTSSRSRTQSRKKVNDDAAYFGPPASSTSASATKRQAPDKAEGEPRVKRKRVETGHIVTPASGKRDNMESEPRKSLVSGPFSRSWCPEFRLDICSRLNSKKCQHKYSIVTWHSSTLYLAFTRRHFLLKTHLYPRLLLTPNIKNQDRALLQY